MTFIDWFCPYVNVIFSSYTRQLYPHTSLQIFEASVDWRPDSIKLLALAQERTWIRVVMSKLGGATHDQQRQMRISTRMETSKAHMDDPNTILSNKYMWNLLFDEPQASLEAWWQMRGLADVKISATMILYQKFRTYAFWFITCVEEQFNFVIGILP